MSIGPAIAARRGESPPHNCAPGIGGCRLRHLQAEVPQRAVQNRHPDRAALDGVSPSVALPHVASLRRRLAEHRDELAGSKAPGIDGSGIVPTFTRRRRSRSVEPAI
jgi:hypothetical protein